MAAMSTHATIIAIGLQLMVFIILVAGQNELFSVSF